ncbi:MAG: T9SS type A sorting domain-containing protein [Bacteroidota bacterium]
MKTLKHSLLLILLSLSFQSLNASVATWLGGTGEWGDDANWSTGVAPDLDDGVIIPSGTVKVKSYSEAAYIHLNGGNLEVHGTLFMELDTIWFNPLSSVLGILIENGSSFDNFGNTVILEPFNFSEEGIHILCDANLTNHSGAMIFCQGQHSTGIHSILNASTIHNYGSINMASMETGLYLVRPFINHGSLDIQASSNCVLTRDYFETASSSTMEIEGKITDVSSSTWIHKGSMVINYIETASSSAISIAGTLDMQTSGSISINGTHHNSIYNAPSGTFRVRGDLDIKNDKAFGSAISNSGFFVNHQNGSITTDAHRGVVNASGAEIRNFGLWNTNNVDSNNFCSILNYGVFSNRPKGKLYVRHRLYLQSGGWFNNQGHMFVLDDIPHLSLLGQFNNTGTLNDVYDHMAAINNNTSYRVHKMTGPFTEGIPVPNILDKGASPAATVLSWYTTAGGNTIAGSYNSATNTFTPNANAVGLTSLFVRTRINTGGVTRRHELIVEGGIQSNPSPLAQQNQSANLYSDANFSVAPNPIHDSFTIQSDKEIGDELRYTIMNSAGQLEKSGRFFANENVIELPQYLPSGIYFLQVLDMERVHVDTRILRVIR